MNLIHLLSEIAKGVRSQTFSAFRRSASAFAASIRRTSEFISRLPPSPSSFGGAIEDRGFGGQFGGIETDSISILL